ncbi:MAG: potassium transporter Kup [Sphingomonadales bacterium]|nr:potassium transporter Kup [Sphingomonadales bacterium]
MGEKISADAVAQSSPGSGHESASHGGGHGHHNGRLYPLAVGAIGVVFGDIGTSPLYAIQAVMTGARPITVDLTDIYGVVSLIFWSMVLVVTVKYVFFVLRTDNNGEGGSLALLALINRKLPETKTYGWLTACGLLATALFYADSMLTPAISVISAVEGLGVVSERFHPFIVPIAVVILIGLFMIQSRGTERVGRLFGPIMLVYFVTIAAMGIYNIVQHPAVLWEPLNPLYILGFFQAHPLLSFLSLGAVIYAMTGVEALYADMGHFGRKPISVAWLYVVFPCLILNYMGQASLLIRDPSAASNPFFLMVHQDFLIPLVILATLATVIASQAVISGAYSVTQQAMQLGYMPRMQIKHTSSHMAGQIYIPTINTFLACMVAALVISFRSSAAMLPAYGLAVAGTMFITTIMESLVVLRIWKVSKGVAFFGLGTFMLIDLAYLAAGSAKFFEGAWFPVVCGMIIFLLLTTWARGRTLMRRSMEEGTIPMEVFAKSAHSTATRVPGTAIFMASSNKGVPSALLHNIKHNKVLHERVVVLTVAIQNVPYVDPNDRCTMKELGQGFYRLSLRFGFLEETNIPAALTSATMCGGPFEMMKTSFFLSRQTLIASSKPGMAIWREKLFAWMLRNAASAMEFFRLPTNRVVELGSQVEI